MSYSVAAAIDNELEAFSEAELGIRFDELTELSINQPDDELALEGLRSLVVEARDRGQIDMALQMAMTLGAMACLHPHMEDTANQAGDSLEGHTDSDRESDRDHDSKKCSDCRAGRPCSKKS